jgi:hypothetical protein
MAEIFTPGTGLLRCKMFLIYELMLQGKGGDNKNITSACGQNFLWSRKDLDIFSI